MQTPEEFRSFYDRELLPTLQQLESDRKKLISGVFKWIGIGIIPGVLLSLVFMNPEIVWIGVGAAIGIVVYLVLNLRKIREIRDRFKGEVIAKMIKSIGPDLTYNAGQCISQNNYHQSKLYLHSINRYKGDDLVSGVVGKTAIRFSELLTQNETTSRDSNGRETKNVETIFRGLFFVADFNKKFAGETIVLPDTAESLFGSFGTMFQKWNMSRDQLVKMEDVDFEKAFAVYSNDQVEARYILSTSLMQRILQFKEKTRSKIRLSFVGSEVFIAIPLRENLFEAPFLSSMVKYELIEGFNKYLVLFIGIVEDLNLNTRIWTKE